MTERAFYLEEGKIKIHEDVYKVIVANKALETKGVSSLSGSFGTTVSNLWSRKKNIDGVSISFDNEGALEVELSIIVNYGYRIPDVTLRLQERVKTALVDMTEAKVAHVNILVQGIDFEEESIRVGAIKEESHEY